MRTLTEIEHVIARPGMYVGSSGKEVSCDDWVMDDENRCVWTQCTFNPIVRKCVDEVLSNAIDNAQSNPNASFIDIVVNTNCISVVNDGVEMLCTDRTETKDLCLQAAFGTMRTSSHFGDKETSIGTNGLGVKLSNIFSVEFVVELVDKDGAESGFRWTNNMRCVDTMDTVDPKLGMGCIQITFYPDPAACGSFKSLVGLLPWLKHRCLEASTQVGVVLTVNGFSMRPITASEFAAAHCNGEEPTVIANGIVACLLNEPVCNSSTCISLVNGTRTSDHGVHVDQVKQAMHMMIPSKKVSQAMFARIVKEHCFLFAAMNVSSPVFNGQAKHKLVGGTLKTTVIHRNAASFFQALLDRIEMESIMKQPKQARKGRVMVDKLHDAVKAGGKDSLKCTLILTEGDSAKTFAMTGLSVVGHDLFGVFPLRGKALNVRDEDVERIKSNAEWKNVMSILGLQTSYYSEANLRYGHVLILADADLDGAHIAGLIINFFDSLFPSLLLERPNFIRLFRTPVIKTTDKGKVREYFSMHEYNQSGDQGKPTYYKGLGSSSREEARHYFQRMNELTCVVSADTVDDRDGLNAMFSKKHAENRKKLIVEHLRDPEVPAQTHKISATQFIRQNLLYFSAYDVKRSIASCIDGLKPSQRKIVWVTKKMREPMKVAQLASTVALQTVYLHGENSLAEAIIGLAQKFVGSNAHPLLDGKGQFGSRLLGGKDAASPRYIHVAPSTFLHKMILPVDDELLERNEEEHVPVEPKFFVPVLPMVLLNGGRGIATGWSSYVPPYDITDVVAAVSKCLEGEEIGPMIPKFANFKGIVESDGSGKVVTRGIMNRVKGDTWRITELPIGVWTEPFIQKLGSIQSVSKVVSRCDDQTIDIEFRCEAITDVQKCLQSSFSTTNMYLFDENEELKKFDTAESIVEHHCGVRLAYCEKRRLALLAHAQEALRDLKDLERFIMKVQEPGAMAEFVQNQAEFLESNQLPASLQRRVVSDLSSSKLKQTQKGIVETEKQIKSLKETTSTEMFRKDLKSVLP